MEAIAAAVKEANAMGYAAEVPQEAYEAACEKVAAMIKANGGAGCEGCEKFCPDAALNMDVSSDVLVLCCDCAFAAAGRC
jgi:flavoprotein